MTSVSIHFGVITTITFVTAVFIPRGFFPVTGGLVLHASKPLCGVETLATNIG
jgi:hypothetical protein